MNTKEIKSREVVIHNWRSKSSLGIGIPSLLGGFGLIVYGMLATSGIVVLPLVSGLILLIGGVSYGYYLECKSPYEKEIIPSLPRRHYVVDKGNGCYTPCFYKYGSLRYLDKHSTFNEIHEASLAYEKAYKEEKLSKSNSSSIMIVYKGKAPRA